ncbi:cytochrome P450 52A12 [Pyrenophora tritici-repentis Pt-1C-BFP]|uniref:Cytochrome P450 52A12 n=1 Tax=Pyrenophora tritici-repentis (strain Pt-1C-BFP) TaxID=426418 RepID=B2WFU1_PYRTR|nr:cytochrome P450 52A12 [Pyrenophora tritici-repentis Pt-1C-BFP]EDU41848.1 cytochrome P450 52A12 [Pyrenophora tritici-repentis Pt-1C-BFP]
MRATSARGVFEQELLKVTSVLKPNFLFGHLGHITAEIRKLGSTVHPDYALENIWKAHGHPEFIFFDTRPLQFPLLVVTSHEIAEQVSRASKTQPYSVDKSPTVQDGVGGLIGKYSLLSENGEVWRGLRKTFNAGFAPQHLHSLLPVIVDKTCKFMDKLDDLAKSGLAIEMEPCCTNVTFDIMSQVITNIDCKAQAANDEAHAIVRHFRTLKALYNQESGLTAKWLNLPKTLEKYICTKRLDDAIKKCVLDKYAEVKANDSLEHKATKDLSVLALALRDVEEMTPHILQSTADQVKTFLFAGHDTTSILLQRLFYALSIHPHCLAKIRAEHDAIFGDADPRQVFLAQADETMQALKYTSACIKEGLRLWPPAGSARMSHNGFKIRTSEGDDVCVDGTIIYNCHWVIHRDPNVYGETAEDFIPERWFGNVDTGSAMANDDGVSVGDSKLPSGAWRPFERGPRNCIGQELANIEARIILACVIRRYDFIKVGLGEVETDSEGKPIVDKKGKYKTKSELLNIISVTAKPMDHTVMRVKMR